MSVWVLALAALVIVGLLWLAVARWRKRVARKAIAADLDRPHPVVLVHGVMGFDSIGLGPLRQSYFRGVVRHLRSHGVPAHAVRMPPLGAVPDRAQVLASFVRSLPHDKVTVVAHSMGGLDARYAISRLGLADRVDQLITVGTPHRGSPLADLISDTALGRRARSMARKLGLRADAVDWLTTRRLVSFNLEVPDHPNVRYVSVVGRASLLRLLFNPLLWAPYIVMRRRHGVSDGLVPIESQRWGESIEVNADHMSQIGWSLGRGAGRLYEQILRHSYRGVLPVGAAAPAPHPAPADPKKGAAAAAPLNEVESTQSRSMQARRSPPSKW